MENITDERFRGSIGDLRAYQKPGLESFRRFIRGELPGPPISRLLGIRPTEAGLGKATFTMPITRWLEDGFGLYWGGVYALLADAPLASADLDNAARRESRRYVRAQHVVRPTDEQEDLQHGRPGRDHPFGKTGGPVDAPDHRSRRSPARIRQHPVFDHRCPRRHGSGIRSTSARAGRFARSLSATTAQNGYFRLDQVVHGIPIELQRRTIAARRSSRFGASPATGRPWSTKAISRAVLPSSAWFSNGGFSIYGGLLAWAAEFTMGAAVYSTLPPGDVFATLDMHIRFTRPALLDSGDLTFAASVRHRGRRLRVTSCHVDNAEGKRVAMATSSALVVEGGVGELRKGRLPEEILAGAAGAGTTVLAEAC